MIMSKVYFGIGFFALLFGACMIHRGLGFMVFGAVEVIISYMIFKKELRKNSKQ